MGLDSGDRRTYKKYSLGMKQCLASFTALLGVFGAVNRGSYTDLTGQDGYLGRSSVAELAGDFAREETSKMEGDLPSCGYIFGVVPTGGLRCLGFMSGQGQNGIMTVR